MNKETYDLACKYKRCFLETADGKDIFADLKKGYCRMTTFHPDATAMAFLEGHRDVVLRIEHLIEMASKKLDEVLEEDHNATGNDGDDDDPYFKPKSIPSGHYL